MSTKNLKAPHECPAVGMKLGGGSVDFGKKFPFEGSERETHSYALEHGLVHEEKGFPLSRSVSKQTGSPGLPGRTDMWASCVRQKALKLYKWESPR